ncbi:hypothetical protein ACFQGX_01185 [Nonomuraea dietziae]|uniref:hypothetical protein n=1 Tax=Nonomuraea dietziae TaxID=65515 RepID=UPI00361FFA56
MNRPAVRRQNGNGPAVRQPNRLAVRRPNGTGPPYNTRTGTGVPYDAKLWDGEKVEPRTEVRAGLDLFV